MRLLALLSLALLNLGCLAENRGQPGQPREPGVHICCPYGAIPCGNDPDECISPDWICDGQPDCENNWDESKCKFPCEEGEFYGDEECLTAKSLCDGIAHCHDGWDERDCTQCQSGAFLCDNKICHQAKEMCDGKKDCADGLDERSCYECKAGRFSCGGGKCIYPNQTCDGIPDCAERQDEEGCTKCIDIHAEGKNFCSESPQRRCNGVKECPDGGDEMGCKHCKNGAILCDDHRCVREISQCAAKEIKPTTTSLGTVNVERDANCTASTPTTIPTSTTIHA